MSHPRRSRLIGLSAGLLALTFVPTPMLAADTEGDGPVAIARSYVADQAASLGVRAADVTDLRVASSYRSAHTGVTHVNMNQRFDSLEVFGAYVTVNITSDREVLFAGDSLVKGLADASGVLRTDATEAVEAAAGALGLDDPSGLQVISERDGPARRTVVSRGGISDAPIPARLGWQPTDDGLRLAWQLVIDAVSEDHLWNATVDAATGELLARDDWVDHDTVAGLSSALARPSILAQASPGITTPNPVADGSSYRVFQLPKESPNDGDRTLVADPADATASPFGWHDTDGDIDPDFTVTRGNNAHAYTDHNASNDLDESTPAVIVDPPSAAAGQYDAVRAAFGPNIPWTGARATSRSRSRTPRTAARPRPSWPTTSPVRRSPWVEPTRRLRSRRSWSRSTTGPPSREASPPRAAWRASRRQTRPSRRAAPGLTSTTRSISAPSTLTTTGMQRSRTSSTGTTSPTTCSTGTGSTRRRATSRSPTTVAWEPAVTTSGPRPRTAAGSTTPTSPPLRWTAGARGCRCSFGISATRSGTATWRTASSSTSTSTASPTASPGGRPSTACPGTSRWVRAGATGTPTP